MKAIVCEMCGSQDLVKQGGMYVCQNCGTKYDAEEAKKLLVDVSGTVKVDNSDIVKNYLQLARRAKDTNNAVDAVKYYNLILQNDPNNWEAQFYSVYYRVSQCTIAEIPNASTLLANCISSVLVMLKKNEIDIYAQANAMLEILKKCQEIIIPLFTSVWKGYDPNGYNNNPLYFKAKSNPIISILAQFGKDAETLFGLEPPFDEVLPFIWRSDVVTRKMQAKYTATEEEVNAINKLIARIKEFDPSYNEEEVKLIKKSGCYVATAVYGSYDCPEVWTLRRYRDYTLAETWYGRLFIFIYYAISPTLVKWFGETQWFKNMWKPKLDRMVKKLNKTGVADTPYQDRNW